jgi:hypothetical protein
MRSMTDDANRTRQTLGAWIVHHGQKTASDINGAAEFPALDTAAKAAGLLSQLSATEQTSLEKDKVEALARAARLNTRIELPQLLEILKRARLIDQDAAGNVETLGLTTRATLGHAADIFEDQEPSKEELAAIEVAERSSEHPQQAVEVREYIGDKFKLGSAAVSDFLVRAEDIGFVDSEGSGADKLLFNGNLFRRDNVSKVHRILESLSSADSAKAAVLEDKLSRGGCVPVEEAEKILGVALFEKLKAAGMYDVNQVSNEAGEFGFVTRPAAFHKFVDPLVDDAFDLAKALVAALTYGMTRSPAGRGHIYMIEALLRKLIRGHSVGPATAIGEDYRVLERRGVIQVTRAGWGYTMRLLKRDIGEIALSVLTTGDAATATVFDQALPGQMTDYHGPEQNRVSLRKRQSEQSRKLTLDVLSVLRTRGSL